MKIITIFQDGQDPIEFEDNDDTPLEEYKKRISNIFLSKQIAIFESEGNLAFIRPCKIISVKVKEIVCSGEKQEDEDIMRE